MGCERCSRENVDLYIAWLKGTKDRHPGKGGTIQLRQPKVLCMGCMEPDYEPIGEPVKRGVSVAEIRDFKELKREVKKLITEKHMGWIYAKVLEVEASVKDDLDKIEYVEDIPTTEKELNLMKQSRAETLRRLLEVEGGEKGKG